METNKLDKLKATMINIIFGKVTCKSWYGPTGVFNSSSVIGTDSCYGLFERGNKTVQAKTIQFVQLIPNTVAS